MLAPGALPKFEPVIVIEDPTGPEEGRRVLIVGAPRATLTVVVIPAMTKFEAWNVVGNPAAETETSYGPGANPEIE